MSKQLPIEFPKYCFDMEKAKEAMRLADLMKLKTNLLKIKI